MSSKILRILPLMALGGLLSGCKLTVLDPAGDVAAQQSELIAYSTYLMLIIIVPVIALTLFFAWRYRASNTSAKYDPEWSHSTGLEVVIWTAPLVIIIALGALTWVSTHLLDPYRPIARIDANRPVPADAKPLEVDVVALDWKWLFILPEQGIATVNELAAPVDVPIKFRITASSVMNTLSIPALAGMVYAMPGMVTQLHAVINKPGEYAGLSANYSGAGFSNMTFKFHGMSQADFDRWVAQAKSSNGGNLGRAEYTALARPSIKEPVRRYASIDPQLFGAIADMCVEEGQMCASEMMRLDAQGGTGMAGTLNVVTRTMRRGGVARAEGVGQDVELPVVLAFCTPTRPTGLPTEISDAEPALAAAASSSSGTAE
ncbi:ubiquinol oxidase subunit II [Roseomonas chloroacetimidivorans]|jgi:cytochrome o ubiquinol oxidase subunit 2|uniref:ubiquinol oxidase subunit II n=1 Tax=Roseomonas chloroacetimidivorans TaxID=1766656 RepID=UPI003C763994